MFQDQRCVFMASGTKYQRDRDDQWNVVQQVGWGDG